MRHKWLKNLNARNITMTGLMMALTIVATIIIKIPIPATEGFVNAGDSIILITAYFFGGVPAVIAGGLGSMLADIIVGYAHWAPFTLIIKGLEGALCGLLMFVLVKKLGSKNKKMKSLGIVISSVISVLFMVLGYFIVEIFMYGLAPAAMSILFNLIQAGVSAAIGLFVIFALKNVNFNGVKKIVDTSDEVGDNITDAKDEEISIEDTDKKD